MKDEEESFIARLSVSAIRPVRDVWFIWLTLVLLTTLPYIAAALRTPSGQVFSGVLSAYDDTFTYYAWMREGANGHLLMCNPFTSEPQRCEFFLPLWGILGFISRITHIPIPVTFHIARLMAVLFLLVVARAVARTVMRARGRVQYSLWLYVLSGGVGWVVYALQNAGNLFAGAMPRGSADLNLPEAIAFRSVFSQVHFAVGVILVAAAINLFFRALVEKKPSRGLLAGMLVSLLAVVHPYMVFVVSAVAGVAFIFLPWLEHKHETARETYYSTAKTAVALILGTLPGVAYAVYLSFSSEILREWLRVTDTFSPPPWEYALGFGIVGALAVVGYRLLWNQYVPYGRLLLIWAVVHAALLYAPMSIQRRFIEGLQLPLAIAAAAALYWIAHRAFKGPAAARNRRIFLISAVAIASLTNVGFWVGQMVSRGAGSGATDPRRYLDSDLTAAFDWLRTNAHADAVLFSSYLTGNVAPSMTGFRVFLGHYAQTLKSDEKGAQTTAFYSNAMNDETARKLFEEHRVRYVIYGPFERTVSSSFVPPAWLSIAYNAGGVSVFEVRQ
jgi:hypothetical protein